MSLYKSTNKNYDKVIISTKQTNVPMLNCW